jgi:hypothetical protein
MVRLSRLYFCRRVEVDHYEPLFDTDSIPQCFAMSGSE